jgi:glycosyltransferase involved in cell wall biosynthesis
VKPVCIVNDFLGGWLGERTFWNYMLEGIPEIQGFDHKTLGCHLSQISTEAGKRVSTMPPDSIVIQNATFLDKVSDANFTIAFLQDNLRSMGRRDVIQESVLRSSQMIVANSHETARSYSEFNPVVISIGIDSSVFYSKDNEEELREKYCVPTDRLVGIFVGDFTEVKGWNEIKRIVDSNPEIFFILVSKRAEGYEVSNTKCFNKVSQNILAELYNCSDFFILGSPIETQCLAALEAGFCGLPIIMKRTGIFMDFTDDQRNQVGVFNNDLSLAFQEFLRDTNRFSPRETLLSLDFGIDSMISKWKALLENL